MRRSLYILLLLVMSLPMMAGIHTYTDRSVLSQGKWVKIRVSESGVCRMSFSQIEEAGLNPQQLRVFGYGGAQLEQDFSQPKADDLPQVPVFVGDGYVLFWVQGPISWSYDGERFAHTRNTYSDYGYYLLTDNTGSMLPLPMAEAISGTPTEVSSFTQHLVHNYDSLNLIDRNGIAGGGRDFYGEQFNPNQRRSFSFSTPNAVAGESSSLYISVAARADATSYFYANPNSTSSRSVAIGAYPDQYTMAKTGVMNITTPATAGSQRVQLTYQSSASGSLGWLDYIEWTVPTALQMSGSWMGIRTTVNYHSSVPVRFHLSSASSATQIWDVTDLAHIVRMPATLSGSELQWTGTQADGIHEYVAVNTQGSQWVSAQIVGGVPNQNIHSLKNIDYVIICPEGYEEVSRTLARAHEEKEGITWAVVTDQQAYNEFSSGTPDATAYRWLMKMLYDRAGGAVARPRWLLLMGHGTFDNRKLLPNSGARILLTYESKNSVNEVNAYATDDYFGFLDDSEGSSDTAGRMDIGVGRLPVSSVEEAQQVVNKLVAYIRNDQPGKWKNQLLFLADDGEHGAHTKTSEAGAEKVRLKNPDFVVHKLFLDAYPQEVNASGESYPLAKNKLDNLLKNGVLFFDYSGHGGYNAITSEGMLTLNEIEAMNNKNLAFWFFATCSFAHCDAGRRSAAEAAVLNPNGGAVGVLSATRTVYASQNTTLNGNICDTLFGHSNKFHYDMTLGEATAAGKNRTGADPNKMAYVLLGDPAMRINYPTLYHVQTLTKMDTLRALDIQHVEGQIIDEDSLPVTTFNGRVEITIYDKMQVIHTRDNDANPGEEQDLYYNDYPNMIYTGQAEVKDGRFSYTFMVPKDIRYNFGSGRIVYYAYTTDSLNLEEAVGHFEDFTVGGTGSILSADTLGPEMTIYLNTPAFRSGDKTYDTPRFFAELYDQNGINTAGAGIGHDLMLIVDDNPKKTYSLNEYYSSQNGSYQSGRVSYLMESMEDGPHSLTFRAWDMLNNSTTRSLSFVVEKGLDPSIYSVTTYPNPVSQTGLVNLVVNYDQPDELISTELYLYNMSGQIVWSHQQENPDQVQIPLYQIGLLPGVYMYQIRIRSANSRYSRAAGKIIVTQ